MAIRIKTAAAIARKWAEVTPARSKVWEEEVKATPDAEYSGAAVAAAPIWEQGVIAAAAQGLYHRGVGEAGPKWKRKSLALGPGRYGPGVRAAEQDQSAGFAPYRDVIANLSLSPKGPRGSPGNYERVREVGEALNEARTGG